jgi:hypothetical protein
MLCARVRAEVDRAADQPDYYSTVPTEQLQTIFRNTPTLPLEKLINTDAVRIDFERERIFRDIYWKGSFATDTLLGWEERIRTAGLGPGAQENGKIFAGGSFWKRFDKVKDGVATGLVVNYNLTSLPGDPEVRRVEYPNDDRAYLAAGDPILLLHYRNQPYKMVYDLIKIIDENNCIGIMHLGDFPSGFEFATFVMARHNYPFSLATEEDRKLIAAGPGRLADEIQA